MLKFTNSLPPEALVIIDCFHQWELVLLSYLLAALSAYTSINLLGRVLAVNSKREKNIWVLWSGVSLGCGIWAMHFTGMEAFNATIPIAYDFWLTLASLLFAIGFCCISFKIYSIKQSRMYIALASILLGTGICLMHYTGMEAMIMPATIYYKIPQFLLSIIIALTASWVALNVAQYFFKSKSKKSTFIHLFISALMGLAIFGMHYTGMWATELVSQEQPEIDVLSFSTSSLLLILMVAIGTVLILISSLVLSIVHKRWQKDQQHISEVEALLKELEKAKQSMKQLAYSDPVTKLDNRHSFMEYLNNAVKKHEKDKKSFSLLFLDLDDFKLVNDSYGHALGDALLKEVATRLHQNVRSTDVVGRFGGDEFVIILQEEDVKRVANVSKKITDSLAEEFQLEGKTLYISASLGISHFPIHGKTPGQLISNADIALYKAKSLGKNRAAEFDTNMQKTLHQKVLDESDLRKAIDSDAIFLEYQPIVDANSYEIVQFEALARWKRDGDLIGPEYFIEIAEQRNLIIPLGGKIISRIFSDLAMLNSQGITNLQFSMNLSPFQFGDSNIIDKFKSLLVLHKIAPSQLEVELTENSLFKNIETSINQLKELKKLGISISIDDFGTGYSSLSHLKRLPIDKLKIDRSFVSSIPDDLDDSAITQAVIAMSQKLHLKVVAEGIETLEQAEFFAANHCDYLQGYYFSRSMMVNEIKPFIKQHIKRVKQLKS